MAILWILIGIVALYTAYRLVSFYKSRQEDIRSVPSIVKRLLIADFKMTPAKVAELRCRTIHSKYVEESVRYLGVFDPALQGTAQSTNYKEMTGNRGSLLFEARIWSNDLTYLEDRRAQQPLFVLGR